MRVLMTGGGTGGHVNPAIAIADLIKKNIPGAEIAFVGTEHGIENRLVPQSGYALYHVNVSGFSRRHLLSMANLKAAFHAITSPFEARKIIKEFRPDLVIGTGGYVSWPLIVAASRMNIPTIVHESNATPGLTVKKLQHYVDEILVNFSETAEELTEADRVIRVGNPLRGDFGRYDKAEARRELGIRDDEVFILSYGGSMGAERVNGAMLDVMREYDLSNPSVRHLHATGKIEYEESMRLFREAGLEGNPRIRMQEYIYDMPLQMAAADIVVCRAGAMTLTELAMMGKAAILIPSPNVTNNHQYKNAAVLAKAGAAVLVAEKELTAERIVSEVRTLAENKEKRTALEMRIRNFADADTSKCVFRELVHLVGDNRLTLSEEDEKALGEAVATL
ncbi:MAG: undecaprenyldiphospho-muramoylpentapeptide beta-N-acetylglucosaminyltransferase [Clostridia bacterium]|nr:undecaprenyldiphospho-muramoylpentapeptide beta-N-acetylglucosaminyltransferase [Clostridia bacterium]